MRLLKDGGLFRRFSVTLQRERLPRRRDMSLHEAAQAEAFDEIMTIMSGKRLQLILSALCISASAASYGQETASRPLRLLYWNIQNGMWSGQDDNYGKFADWVKRQDPDICVWCEAQTIYESGTADPLDAEERYLTEHWGELARRYGHAYWYVGGHRDNYPQVITSKYPIENIKRITGEEPDSVVSHGAGWARIAAGGKELNIVTLHAWPMQWAFRAADPEASKAGNGGDRYRRMEIEYICRHTIGTSADAAGECWIMLGDFNSRSRSDNAVYGYPEDSPAFLAHDYIAQATPYIDVIAEKHPGEFKTTTGGKARIDFVYCTRPLFDTISFADVITDEYTTPVRDPNGLSNFWRPSDHRPIVIDFDLNRPE